MKRDFKFYALLLAAMTAFSACSSKDDTLDLEEEDDTIILLDGTNIQLTPEQSLLARKTNDFAFELFRAASKTQAKEASQLLSPISATYVLGMLNSGAEGETARQLASVLGFGEKDKETINEFCRKIMTEMPSTDPNVTLKVANYMAANKRFSLDFEPQYESDMRHFYDAELAELDFELPSDLKVIDNWCSDHTNGLIQQISEQIKSGTMLAILNATYFKAVWNRKFKEKNTRTETFTQEGGKQQKVKMMHQKFFGQYWINDLYATLCLPYGAGFNWSMYILLPNKGKTVNDIINHLTKDNWESDHSFTKSSIVDVKLPRFATNSEVDLKPVIEQMGAPMIFDDATEFTKMFTNAKELKVGKLIQKNFTQVNEEGSEAAAITLAAVESSAAGPSTIHYNEVDFHCDHPFVYFIKESSSNIIFFIGAYRGE